MARATGLEPATTGSTVRYSNHLSYAPAHEWQVRPLTHLVSANRRPQTKHSPRGAGFVKPKRERAARPFVSGSA